MGSLVRRRSGVNGDAYAARHSFDVLGDWCEEVIVLSGKRIAIQENAAENPRPDEPRLWKDRNYRRLKQGYNYYSP